METNCRYLEKDNHGRRKCMLATEVVDPNGVYIAKTWCTDQCWPNHIPAQLAMLKRFNIQLPELPKGKDLLGWAEKCVGAGTVKLSDSTKKTYQRKKEAEDERQRLLAEMPSGFELAKNLMKHLKEIHAYYKKTKQEGILGIDGKLGQIKVDDQHSLIRLSICGNCPDGKMVLDDNGVARCTLPSCGCYLNNPNGRKLLGGRVEYWALPCDNGHWDGIDSKMRKEVSDGSEERED